MAFRIGNTSPAIFLFLLIISQAQSRVDPTSPNTGTALVCNKVYGHKFGDTCFSIAQMFNLTPQAFSLLNPNLNCDKIFVGQWLCLDGSAV